MTSVLHSAPRVPEGFLSDLVHVLSAQAEIVAVVGFQDLMEDVVVIRRILVRLVAVD